MADVLADHRRSHWSPRIFVVKFEDLCADPQAETRRITIWLGLAPHETRTPIRSLCAGIMVHSPEEQAEIERLTGPLADAWPQRTAAELLTDFADYAPPYLLGDDIQLNDKGADGFLQYGFSFREEWGRWTEGHHAAVSIEHGLARGLILVELHVAQSHSKRGVCDVIIRSGWGEPKLFSLPPGLSRIALVIRAEEAEERGTCSLERTIVEPKDPDDPPADRRVLGILLASIRLSKVPAPEPLR